MARGQSETGLGLVVSPGLKRMPDNGLRRETSSRISQCEQCRPPVWPSGQQIGDALARGWSSQRTSGGLSEESLPPYGNVRIFERFRT